MRKMIQIAVIFGFALLLIQAHVSPAQVSVNKLYVKVPEENLRSAPKGKKVGALLEGTETTVLVEKDNWVKVQVTGWIWKPSLTSSRPTIEGEYRALHILVKTRAEADAILKELKGGKDFKEVAKAKSILPNATKGGDLGYFNKGDFSPKIEEVIQKLSVNQTSEIVQTEFGFNIFKRLK